MPPPSRQQEGQLEILEKAAEVIAERGFHGMSMRELASVLGKSLAGFYNYYRSKEDLLQDLQLRAFETLAQSAEQALAKLADPSDRLYAFMLQHVRYVASHHAVMQVLVQEASALPANKRRPVREAKERYFEIGRGVVAEALRSNACATSERTLRIDTGELERQTYALFGMLNWTYGWYRPSVHGPPEELARTIHRLAVCGLRPDCPGCADVSGVEVALRDMHALPLLQLAPSSGARRSAGRRRSS